MISVIGIVGIAMQTLLSRTLFAMKKIKISAIISASLICVYICLSILFSRIFGLNGIAMGTALSYTFGGTVYYVILKKICPEFRYKANLITLFKTVGCTAVMLSIMFLIERIVSLSIISLTVLLAVSGAVVYFATAQFVHLKNASIQSFLGILKREK